MNLDELNMTTVEKERLAAASKILGVTVAEFIHDAAVAKAECVLFEEVQSRLDLVEVPE